MTGPEDLQSNRARIALEMPREAFRCPVLGCSWTATAADVEKLPIEVPICTVGDVSEYVSVVATARAKAVDAFLRQHLETHNVIDYLRTIRDLEQQVYNAGHTGVRPHRRTTEMPGHELVGIRDSAQAEIARRARGPHRVAEMTGEQRGRAAETLQRYNEIDDGR